MKKEDEKKAAQLAAKFPDEFERMVFGGLLGVAVLVGLFFLRAYYVQGAMEERQENSKLGQFGFPDTTRQKAAQQVNGAIGLFLVVSVIVLWRMKKKNDANEKKRIATAEIEQLIEDRKEERESAADLHKGKVDELRAKKLKELNPDKNRKNPS